jgi:queuine tRNA-ribosyltransferase
MGAINLKNARHKDDPRPLDAACTCPACRSYSRAYLHHVVKADEIIGSMLLTWHNLHYYQDLMQGLRDAIGAGRLAAFVADFHAQRAAGDIDPVYPIRPARDKLHINAACRCRRQSAKCDRPVLLTPPPPAPR